MSERGAASAWLAGLCLLTLGTAAQPPRRLGGEFQVNTYTNSDQGFPAVARASNGDFVVTWPSFGQDGSNNGVFARRFDSAGQRLGAEFQVNTLTTGTQNSPEVAGDDSGGFVVVWRSSGQDGDSGGLFGQRFNASGSRLGAEFQVNTYTLDSQFSPAVAVDADGDFVVVWASSGQDGSYNGVFGRRFAANGSPQAAEFQVSLYTPGDQYHADVAVDADGDFVAVWQSADQDGSANGIFARRFPSGGAPGGEFLVAQYTYGTQLAPVVAMDDAGDFVVAWRSGQDGDLAGVFARRFSASGAPHGAEFQVNLYTTSAQSNPLIDMDPDGDFVISWTSQTQDGFGLGAFARYFDASGTALGGEFELNSFTPNDQSYGDIGMDGDGNFVVAWNSVFQDGYGSGVFAQRFSPPALLDLDGNGVVGALTDGLLLLRFLFGFTGPTLTTGAVGGGCTRCDAAAIEPYLALTGSLGAQNIVRFGGEFQVNTYTASYQYRPAIARESDGDFVVVWASVQDGSNGGVFGQRFDSAGVRRGTEFRVNTYTTSFQEAPDVAIGAGGSFIVVWSSSGQDGSGTGIFGRRFASSGTPLATEFRLNAFTPNHQYRPKVGVDASGKFVAVWQSYTQDDGSDYGIFGRRFASDGSPQDVEFQVNLFTPGKQEMPNLAVRANGDFIVVWRSPGNQDGSGYGIIGRAFPANNPPGPEFLPGTNFTGDQAWPAVAVNGDVTGFAAVWQTPHTGTAAVFGRRFIGSPPPEDSQINVGTAAAFVPAIAMDAAGAFAVTWISDDGGSMQGIFARDFDSSGAPIGGDLAINSYTVGIQIQPDVAMDGDGDFVVAWTSNGQDGLSGGIFAQRLGLTRLFDVDGNGSITALTDGLLVLRFLFGFTGTTLTSGAVGGGCTRCDAAAIESYLHGLV